MLCETKIILFTIVNLLKYYKYLFFPIGEDIECSNINKKEHMLLGILFALLAGLMWGIIFISPLLLPDYPAILQSMGRYLFFGIVTFTFVWSHRQQLRALSKSDWKEALILTLVGNIVYYSCLASAIQRAGPMISSMIIGTLPVVIPIAANILYSRYDGKMPWKQLLPALVCMGIGLLCVNISELKEAPVDFDIIRYISGIVLCIGALLCWTFYPMRNSRWLRQHPDQTPMTWAIAQGVITLPVALFGYLVASGVIAFTMPEFALPFGPTPVLFIGVTLMIAVLCSWLGTYFWNAASQRVPTAFLGPFIVFETLSGLLYSFILKQTWPSALTVCGIIALVIGVCLATRIKVKPAPAEVIVSGV